MTSVEDGLSQTRVQKYMHMLSIENKIGHALKRLANIDMTLELLSETGVGKVVNQLRSHETFGEEASSIVEKWKEMARSHGLKQRKNKRVEEGQSINQKEEVKSNDSAGSKVSENGASSSAMSFADMLSRGDVVKPWKPKKLKLDCNDWKTSDIDVNYRPSKVLNFEPKPIISEPRTDMASLDASMFKPRKNVRKIYAGRPKGDVCREVPVLQTLCLKVLAANIDAIDEIGDAPYFLLKPVLEKCSAEQLLYIERKNPHLMEDSDELWQRIVNRCFSKFETSDDESWRECYFRLNEENDRKLKLLSSRITKHNRETTAPIKTALLADAKAPREVRRLQRKYGTEHAMHQLPSASEISKARKQIFENGTKNSLNGLPESVRNNSAPTFNGGLEKKLPPKKGALMLKTLKMMKVKNRR